MNEKMGERRFKRIEKNIEESGNSILAKGAYLAGTEEAASVGWGEETVSEQVTAPSTNEKKKMFTMVSREGQGLKSGESCESSNPSSNSDCRSRGKSQIIYREICF